MEPRVHFITVGVADVDAARAFYVDGLGWTPIFEIRGDITFLQVGPGLVLGLWGEADLRRDSGLPPAPPAGTPAPFTLSHNVDSEAEVVDVVRRAVAAGATLLKEPQRADFGGFHGHFADPAGICWEICHNPGWHVDDDGTVHIA